MSLGHIRDLAKLHNLIRVFAILNEYCSIQWFCKLTAKALIRPRNARADLGLRYPHTLPQINAHMSWLFSNAKQNRLSNWSVMEPGNDLFYSTAHFTESKSVSPNDLQWSPATKFLYSTAHFKRKAKAYLQLICNGAPQHHFTTHGSIQTQSKSVFPNDLQWSPATTFYIARLYSNAKQKRLSKWSAMEPRNDIL